MAIFAHCANLCCPNFCHFLSWYDKAQGPFWSPSFPSSGYVSLIMGSSRFGIRNFKVDDDSNFTYNIHSFFVNRMNVIGYGALVLGSEKDNPNHPNIFMLKHLGNEERRQDSRRKKPLYCKSHSCHDGWKNEDEFGEECSKCYAFATSSTFSQGIFIKFSWVEAGLLISFLKKVDTLKSIKKRCIGPQLWNHKF